MPRFVICLSSLAIVLSYGHLGRRKEACNSYLAIAQRLDPSNERFRAVFKSLDVLNKPWYESPLA